MSYVEKDSNYFTCLLEGEKHRSGFTSGACVCVFVTVEQQIADALIIINAVF